jgi:hypothetical protein
LATENVHLRSILRVLYQEVASLLVTSSSSQVPGEEDEPLEEDLASNCAASVAGESVMTVSCVDGCD